MAGCHCFDSSMDSEAVSWPPRSHLHLQGSMLFLEGGEGGISLASRRKDVSTSLSFEDL